MSIIPPVSRFVLQRWYFWCSGSRQNNIDMFFLSIFMIVRLKGFYKSCFFFGLDQGHRWSWRQEDGYFERHNELGGSRSVQALARSFSSWGFWCWRYCRDLKIAWFASWSPHCKFVFAKRFDNHIDFLQIKMVKRRSIQIPPGHLAANIIPLVRNNVTHGKKKSDVFVTLSNYQLKICNIVNILVYY